MLTPRKLKPLHRCTVHAPYTTDYRFVEKWANNKLRARFMIVFIFFPRKLLKKHGLSSRVRVTRQSSAILSWRTTFCGSIAGSLRATLRRLFQCIVHAVFTTRLTIRKNLEYIFYKVFTLFTYLQVKLPAVAYWQYCCGNIRQTLNKLPVVRPLCCWCRSRNRVPSYFVNWRK